MAKIINFFGKALKDFDIELIDISSLFKGKEEIIYQKKIQDKEISFKFPKTPYIFRLKKGKKDYEKLILSEQNIKLPFSFTIFFRSKKIPLNERHKLAEKYRWDRKKCYQCKKRYTNFINIFECPYCNRIFCEKHRIPENHNCKNPKKPEEYKKGSGGRIIYSKPHSYYSPE